AVVSADASPYARSLVAGMQNSGYFGVDRILDTQAQAEDLLAHGSVQFVITIPEGFGRRLTRGEKPVLLVEADATDPRATGNAIATHSTSSSPRRRCRSKS